MADVSGTGPVSFYNADGTMISIPLSALTFTGSTLTLKTTSPPAPVVAGLQDWLDVLNANKVIVPLPST